MILNLILSVVPDPTRCVSEAIPVLKPGGRIIVFDKFLPDGSRPGLMRRLSNVLSTLLGTDINRRLADIIGGLPCELVHDEPSLLGGMYRNVLLRDHRK
jgi:ubiquinone/menaquinone biosynthesis C-methylase UbiE